MYTQNTAEKMFAKRHFCLYTDYLGSNMIVCHSARCAIGDTYGRFINICLRKELQFA